MKQYFQEKHSGQKNFLSVSIQGKQQEILLDTVLYFTSNVRKIGIFFLNDDREIWFYGKLDELEKKLEPYGFIRCHQSYLVNGHKVESVKGDEIVTAGGVFPISRKYTEKVKEKWEQIRQKLYAGANIEQLTDGGEEQLSENEDGDRDIGSTVVLTKRHSGALKYGTIIGIRGARKNASFRVYDGDDAIIGRDRVQCQIAVDQPSVSRKHCAVRFSMEEQCFYICDYSINGTMVSGIGALPRNDWVRVERDSLLQLVDDNCAFMLL
jgi:hypothetical protein